MADTCNLSKQAPPSQGSHLCGDRPKPTEITIGAIPGFLLNSPNFTRKQYTIIVMTVSANQISRELDIWPEVWRPFYMMLFWYVGL